MRFEDYSAKTQDNWLLACFIKPKGSGHEAPTVCKACSEK